jgi:hypothetical protein
MEPSHLHMSRPFLTGDTQEHPMETVFADYQQLFRNWLEFVSEATSAAAAGRGADLVAARKVRDAYFQMLSRQTDEYFRSPQFLESMKPMTFLNRHITASVVSPGRTSTAS